MLLLIFRQRRVLGAAAAVGAETTVGLTHAAAHGVKCRYY